MLEGYDEQRLKEKTEAHWEELRNNAENPQLVWRKYVTSLLPQEMEAMRVAGRSPLEDEDKCRTLVLLVGHSIEPLLQSVWAYRPQELLLILNEWYGDESGDDFAIGLRDLLSRLPEERQVPKDCIHQKAVQPTPADVFRALVERVRDREKVVVDITGAKKSMVTGAFLYAAYANVPVSYVDFDDTAYNTKYMRPYGYASHIHSFENPYTIFALRYWERVRQLYWRYKFRDARLLLSGEDDDGKPGTLLAIMREYLPESESAIQKLAEVLRCYELWDSGDYNQAAGLARRIDGFEPPTAVSMLDGKWFRTENRRFIGGPSDFYEDTPDFQAYVHDEMARIERLIKINHDYRSAFLRAGSLNEIVILARLVYMVGNHPQKDDLVRVLQEHTPNARTVFKQLIKPCGTTVCIGKDIWIRKDAPEITIQIPKTMNHWWKQECASPFNNESGWSRFIDRRNDLTHKYFSVPRSWANGGLGFVRANIEDLWGPQPREMITETIRWHNLCRLTGLYKYLSPNLCSDEMDKEGIR